MLPLVPKEYLQNLHIYELLTSEELEELKILIKENNQLYQDFVEVNRVLEQKILSMEEKYLKNLR